MAPNGTGKRVTDKNDPHEDDIVISGISGRYPESGNTDEFWDNLMSGIEMVSADERRWPLDYLNLPKRNGKIKDLGKFDAGYFNVTETEATQMDPQARIIYETTHEAIFDAGLTPDALRGSNTCVFIGNCSADYVLAMCEDPMKVTGTIPAVSGRIAYAFDFKGASGDTDTACASSMSALHEAIGQMKAGDSDSAIVGGVSVNLRPLNTHRFNLMGMLSPDGRCKCLDASADGYTRSEGVASLLLQRRSAAKRIYATVLNVETNNDGYKPDGITFPSVARQTRLMSETYRKAGVSPCDVGYIEAHLTGTAAGDPVESKAIANVFCPKTRKDPLLVGCVKSNIGHGEGASGVCSLTKACLVFQKKEIPPNLNFSNANPHIESITSGQFKPVTNRTPYDGDLIAINSFGFGGSNVHAVLKANEKRVSKETLRETDNVPRLVTASGRTEEGVQNIFEHVLRSHGKEGLRDQLALLNDAMKTDPSKGLTKRGYILIDNNNNVIESKVKTTQEKKPLWFVFPGFGSQWPSMGRTLIKMEPFATSIKNSAKILQPMGVNLIKLITSNDDQMKDSFVGSFVSIVAIQVGLVDLLNHLELRPDGIVGYSLGEIAAGYADNCLTPEETILTAYQIANNISGLKTSRGAMGSVALSWEELQKRCPPEVYPSGYEGHDLSTISGPEKAVLPFLQRLSSDGISTQELACGHHALHSNVLQAVYQPIVHSLAQIITQPKMRSSRWLSCSVPDERWHEKDAQLLSPTYFARLITSPVNMKQIFQYIPKNAIVVEVGPHPMLSSQLQRGLGPDVICIPMMMRGNEKHGKELFLSSVGEMYSNGHNPSIELLYPRVEYPVGRETPSISPLVKWDHSREWFAPKFPDFFKIYKADGRINIDLRDSKDQFLAGHCIDGRILFPATGYLWLVWEHLTRLQGYNNYFEAGIEFRNVTLHRATILTKGTRVSFKIVILEATGQFEIFEGGTICVTGTASLPEVESTRDLEEALEQVVNPDALLMTSKEVYKELRIRGYDYGPTFQGLTEASSDGTCGKVKWMGNWIAFTDAMLQLSILGKQTRGLILPTFIEYIKCDIKALLQEVKNNENSLGDSEVGVIYEPNINMGATRGLVIKGLKASTAPRRLNVQKAVLESYEFVPNSEMAASFSQDTETLNQYLASCRLVMQQMLSPDKDLDANEMPEDEEKKDALLRVLSQTVKEAGDGEATGNNLVDRLKERLTSADLGLASDLILTLPLNNPRLVRPHVEVIAENCLSIKELKVAEVICGDYSMEDMITHILRECSVKFAYDSHQVSGQFPAGLDSDLIIYKDPTTCFSIDPNSVGCQLNCDSLFEAAFKSLREGGFLLYFYRSKSSAVEIELNQMMSNDNESHRFKAISECQEVAQKQGFLMIGEKFDGVSYHSLLLRKPIRKLEEELPVVIPIQLHDYEWVNQLKESLVDSKDDTRVWLTADSPNSGIIGLVNCLRKEPGGQRVRCLLSPPGEGGSGLTADIIRMDLVMNVYRNGSIGSFRHFRIDDQEQHETETKHAFINVLTKGDLSSFRWFEADHKYWPSLPDSDEKKKQMMCSIYYSALNFRDVMLATGRIPNDDIRCQNYSPIGMEFSGRDQWGHRVMGFTSSKAIATTVLLDPFFVWRVPDKWSLEEASTVPVVYLTVYFGLLIRANLKRGETVLIHAGSGGVGQAAIAVCLSMGCKVYTTVGSKAKREFLKKLFPSLTDNQIANSRDTSFEQQVLTETDGRGVDVVLNSLAEEKFKATIRCLAPFGRFIEIGKYDIYQNSPLDPSDFDSNKTFSVVCLSHLEFDATYNRSASALTVCQRLRTMLEDGFVSGAVVPLKTHVFDKDEVEDAFRFFATGKHTGKVVVKIRAEETETKCLPQPVIVKAVRQTVFHPLKSFIITGGLGGFGLELTSWLISKGAKKVVLSSRSGVKTNYQFLALKHFREEEGATVVVSKADASTRQGAGSLIEEAEALGPVGGVFHLAMVLKDAILENQTVEGFQEVCSAKVEATLNLDELTRKSCAELDYFVCFSSVVAGRGNAGQINYGFANSVMERTCEDRKRCGFPGLAIEWGAIGDVGVVAEAMGGNDVVIGGTVPQRLVSCFQAMEKFLCSSHAVCSSIVAAGAKAKSGEGSGSRDLVQAIGHIMGLAGKTLDPNSTLGNLGLDSLMAVEIRQFLERDYDTAVTVQAIRAMAVKELKELGSKKAKDGLNDKQKDNVDEEAMLALSYPLVFVPSDIFVSLNNVQQGRPLFFLPGIEGDFACLLPICARLVSRPVVGLNWTLEASTMSTIEEAAKYYTDTLRRMYPNNEFDIIGYSFGATLAFEISLQLQALCGHSSVKKLLLLDGSPSYLRGIVTFLNTISPFTGGQKESFETIAEYGPLFVPQHFEYEQFLTSLHEVPSEEGKLQMISGIIEKGTGVKVDSQTLRSSADRCVTKIKMLMDYRPGGRFSGHLLYIRASYQYNRTHRIDTDTEESLLSMINGKCTIISMEGDHRSFLPQNTEAVADLIEDHFKLFLSA